MIYLEMSFLVSHYSKKILDNNNNNNNNKLKASKAQTSLAPKSMKKALRETQSPRAVCSKAEPKFFATPQTPFPWAQGGQYLNSWRW